MTDERPSSATYNSPRTWLLTSALSPIAVRLTRLLLTHGDQVVACLSPIEVENEDRAEEFRDLIDECKSDRKDREGWKERLRGIRCDGKTAGGAEAAVAEAVKLFGGIDILLCCRSESVVGTVEELSTSLVTQNLVREQFEAIFFSQVNFIKAALPQLRSQRTGHIIALTSTGGEIGTPGMATYTAATWAMEGYCDSLAYEIAPFNIKVTIIRPNQEVQILTNKLTFAPQMATYDPALNPAPNMRDMLLHVLNSNPETAVESPSRSSSSPSPGPVAGEGAKPSIDPDQVQGDVIHRFTKLPRASLDKLVVETVHAIAAIGGHENPPSRHIVGWEGASAVKEKLKTVTEEMEDFVDASLAVDISESELRQEARESRSEAMKREPSSP